MCVHELIKHVFKLRELGTVVSRDGKMAFRQVQVNGKTYLKARDLETGKDIHIGPYGLKAVLHADGTLDVEVMDHRVRALFKRLRRLDKISEKRILLRKAIEAFLDLIRRTVSGMGIQPGKVNPRLVPGPRARKIDPILRWVARQLSKIYPGAAPADLDPPAGHNEHEDEVVIDPETTNTPLTHSSPAPNVLSAAVTGMVSTMILILVKGLKSITDAILCQPS